MSHLPDTGKMVSDTPRTDAASAATHGMPEVIGTFRYTFPYVEANFARQLEGELNAANIEIEEKRKDVVWLATEKAKLENYVTELENRLRALWDKYDRERAHYMDRIKRLEDESNELRAEEAQLLNTNGELLRRITRLEKAGDEMFKWSERVGQEYWTKTKEAKP